MSLIRKVLASVSAMSMKARTALAVSFLFLLFVAGLAWVGLSYFQRHFEETVYKQQMALVNSVAEGLDSRLVLARRALAVTADQVKPEMLRDAQQAQAFLDRQQALLSLFDNGLLLISEDGKVVAESPFVSGGRGRGVTHTDVFKGVSANKEAYISRPFASVRANGRPVLSIGIPVLDHSGRIVARLHGSLELLGENLLADLIDLKVGATGYLYLSTTDRLMILHPDRDRIMRPGPGPGQNLVYDRSLVETAGSGRTVTSRGIPMLVSFQRVPSTNWVLGVNYPESEAFAPFHRARTIFIWSLVLGSALLLVCVWWLMRRFMAPLEHMTRHVVTAAQREGEARFLRSTAQDEVGTLGQAFDRMLEQLDAKELGLREANALLEQRVAQRTVELETANAQLHGTVNELKDTREHLVQSEKMAALGALVAGVAHEINTPLGVGVTAASHLQEQVRELEVKAHEETLTRRGLDEFVQRSKESSALILVNLRRAAELISSFKRVAVDQTGGERRTFELAPYLDEVVRSLSPQLRGRPFGVSVSCPQGVNIYADPGEVSQIITNFTMNALMHAFEGRSKGQMWITVTDHSDEVVLIFSDDGVGIAAEVLPRVFDPFFTTKRGQGGSGLGLHLVYNIVTQSMGGRIECRSVPGQGAAFEIHMPRRRAVGK